MLCYLYFGLIPKLVLSGFVLSGEVLVLKDEYPLIAFGENRTDVKVSELFVGGGAWAVRH